MISINSLAWDNQDVEIYMKAEIGVNSSYYAKKSMCNQMLYKIDFPNVDWQYALIVEGMLDRDDIKKLKNNSHDIFPSSNVIMLNAEKDKVLYAINRPARPSSTNCLSQTYELNGVLKFDNQYYFFYIPYNKEFISDDHKSKARYRRIVIENFSMDHYYNYFKRYFELHSINEKKD